MSAIVPNIVQSATTSCDVDSADVIVEPAFQAVTETVTIVTDEEVGVAFDGSEFVNEVEVSSQDEQEEEEEVVDGAWIPPEVRVTVAQRLPLFPSALDPSSQIDDYFSSIDDNMSGLLDLWSKHTILIALKVFVLCSLYFVCDLVINCVAFY